MCDAFPVDKDVISNGLHITDVSFTCNWTSVLHVLDCCQWRRKHRGCGGNCPDHETMGYEHTVEGTSALMEAMRHE